MADDEDFKMDPHMKEQWAGCLMGGEYKQGMAMLERLDGSNCCLGVLEREMGGRVHDLCYPLHPRIGLQHERYLARMNDGGKTFEEIAAWIMENL